MADTLKRLTSEPAVIILILVSLILIKLTFEEDIGTKIITIYLTMAVADIVLYLLDVNGVINSQIKSVSGNSIQSFTIAVVAIVVFSFLYGIVNSFFSFSATHTSYQSVFQSMVKFASIDFSKLTAVKYYLFGILIPIIETRLIARLFGAVAWIINIDINKIFTPKVLGLAGLLSYIFMVFHIKVRGINSNVDLAMTFLFAFISLIIVAYTKEMESANEFHIGTNLLALKYGVK